MHKAESKQMVLWEGHLAGMRAAHGGAHSRVLRSYYRMNHFHGDVDWAPDDYRDDSFMEGDRALVAREVLTVWLLAEPYVLAHARWVIEHNRHDPPEALFSWMDQLLYGNGVQLIRNELAEAVQLTADRIPRVDLCRLDWRAVVAEVRGAIVRPAAMA